MEEAEKSSVETIYLEHHLKTVLGYFIDGYNLGEDKIMLYSEYFIDVHKNKVIIKLTIDNKNTEVIE